MALLNRLFTEAREEPTPHVVIYRDGLFAYVSPRDFYMGASTPKSPSDCTWIVPGTLDWKI